VLPEKIETGEAFKLKTTEEGDKEIELNNLAMLSKMAGHYASVETLDTQQMEDPKSVVADTPKEMEAIQELLEIVEKTVEDRIITSPREIEKEIKEIVEIEEDDDEFIDDDDDDDEDIPCCSECYELVDEDDSKTALLEEYSVTYRNGEVMTSYDICGYCREEMDETLAEAQRDWDSLYGPTGTLSPKKADWECARCDDEKEASDAKYEFRGDDICVTCAHKVKAMTGKMPTEKESLVTA
jgi:hypothetical protein